MREFDAEEPRRLEVAIGRDKPPPLLADVIDLYRPERPMVPQAIYDGDAYGVAVIFKANQDSDRHPFTVSTPEL